MKRRKIKKYVTKRLHQLANDVATIGVHNNQEDIHQLRVHYKQARAFLRAMGNEGLKTGKFKMLKNLYGAAGELRNMQLYRSLLPPGSATTGNDAELAERENALLKAGARVNMHRLQKKLLKNIPATLPKKAIARFIAHNNATINKLLNKHATDADIHAARKALKDILYTISFAGKGARLYPIAHKHSLRQLEQLNDLLSDHQDHVFELQLLAAALAQKSDGTNVEMLRTTQKQLQEEKMKIRARILDDTDNSEPS